MLSSNDFLQIMSLNVAHGDLIDDLVPYLSKQKDHTSVFCLQEVDSGLKNILDELLNDEFCGHYATKPIDGREDYYALITYVHKDLEVLSADTLIRNLVGAGLGLKCHIKGKDDTTLTLINVHGVSQPGTKVDTPARLLQSQAILNSLDNEVATNIVVGDFNLLPDSESIQMFSKSGFHDLIRLYEIPTTRNEIVWSRWPDNKQLYADYAFVGGSSPLAYDFVVDDAIVSDHLPLILKLDTRISQADQMEPMELTSDLTPAIASI